MLVINKQTDYAILFIYNLRQKKDFVPLSEIVEKTKLPQRFLARIAAQLVKNQIITSREGKVGGYKLSINLNKLSLYDFLKIFEKETVVCRCLDDNYDCRYEKICHHHHFLKDQLNNIFISRLKKIKLNQLFDK
jgi:Rrf2 family protein